MYIHDLTLNNLKGLIYCKIQPTNQPTNQPKFFSASLINVFEVYQLSK